MRRVKILGLCLAAVFALTVAVVSGAQAAKYKVGRINVKDIGVGEAELGNSIANLHWKSPGGGGINHEKTSHIVSGNETTGVFARYKGCEVAGKAITCENVGAKGAGETEPKQLVSKLNWINKTKGEVGVDFKAAAEPGGPAPNAAARLADFECKGFAHINVY